MPRVRIVSQRVGVLHLHHLHIGVVRVLRHVVRGSRLTACPAVCLGGAERGSNIATTLERSIRDQKELSTSFTSDTLYKIGHIYLAFL